MNKGDSKNEQLNAVRPWNPDKWEAKSPYTDLAAAIVLQAYKDYRREYRKMKTAREEVERLETFFDSTWFGMLTSINPQVIKDAVRLNEQLNIHTLLKEGTRRYKIDSENAGAYMIALIDDVAGAARDYLEDSKEILDAFKAEEEATEKAAEEEEKAAEEAKDECE